MAVEDDVLVVGGGLAGMTAALGAADTGAQVRVVSASESTLRQASGLIDVLGTTGDGLRSDPFAGFEDLPTGHPYRILGEAAVRAGLERFDAVVSGYRGRHTDRNALVPTCGGTVKPTARYPVGVAAGLASDTRACLLVGIDRVVDFDAPLAAAHLTEANVPFAVSGVTVRGPEDLRPDAVTTRFARALDRDEHGCRASLAQNIKAHLDGQERVGLPAILGRDHPRAVRESLEDALGVDVFEVPMGPPSLPGIRLADQLERALTDAGVRRTMGSPVVDFSASNGTIETVTVDRGASQGRYRADQYVLATGGLVGGGITADRTQVREPVFGCHVAHPADRYDWAATMPFGNHDFPRFGLTVEADLRPRNASGDHEYTNLRAAGAVLAGANFEAELSGSGISIATGFRAGRLAGEAA